MKNIIQKKLFGLALLISLALPTLALAPATFAQVPDAAKEAACQGLGAASGQSCGNDSAGSSIRGLLRTVINLLSWIVGVAAIIMVIIGGLKYVTSNGDSNGISSAKSTIMYALIGLAVAALAQVLVRFVLQNVSSAADSANSESSVRACRDALPQSEWHTCG